jgi:hypothetical protein
MIPKSGHRFSEKIMREQKGMMLIGDGCQLAKAIMHEQQTMTRPWNSTVS